MADHKRKQHDILPALQATLTDVNGKVVDLTGATVRFMMRLIQPSTSPLKVNALCTIVGAATGASCNTPGRAPT